MDPIVRGTCEVCETIGLVRVRRRTANTADVPHFQIYDICKECLMTAIAKRYAERILEEAFGLVNNTPETIASIARFVDCAIDDSFEVTLAPIVHELQDKVDNCCGPAEEAKFCESFGCQYLMDLKKKLEDPQ